MKKKYKLYVLSSKFFVAVLLTTFYLLLTTSLNAQKQRISSFGVAAHHFQADNGFGIGIRPAAFDSAGNIIVGNFISADSNIFATHSWSLHSIDSAISHYTELDPHRITSATISGTTTKIITLLRADGSSVTASFNDLSNSGNGSVSSITLTPPGVIFSSPINFSGTNGAWTGSMTLNNQTSYSVFGNFTSGSATPIFGKLPVQATSATGSTYNGTKYLRDDNTWQTIEVTAPYTVAYSATPNFDYNNSANQIMTMTGNIGSVNLLNIPDGKIMYILFIQDATGSRTLPTPAGWTATTKFIGGSLTLTTTGGAQDLVGVKRLGSTFYVTYGKDFK